MSAKSQRKGTPTSRLLYNGFGDERTLNWNKGETVELELFEEEYNGKMQHKFKLPKAARGGASIDLSGVFEQLGRIETKLDSLLPKTGIKAGATLTSAEPDGEPLSDLPF